MFARFFIDRPIFAGVIAMVITIIGTFCLPLLPLAQYPEIAPPTITVTAVFPGASAETTAETVAAPIEQAINGVEGMMYMSSSSTADGLASIVVTFRPGIDLDVAQVQVQNRIKIAEPKLPAETRQIGVTAAKSASGFLMFIALRSADGKLDVPFLGNYANSKLRERLLRVSGVGDVLVFGGGDYSMRVWIDPARAAARDLTASEIVRGLQTQNLQVAAGALGRTPTGPNAPAFDAPLSVHGQLTTPDEFGEIVLKTDQEGRLTRLRDVARIELGQQDYSIRADVNGKAAVALAITQQPGSNALNAANAVLKEMEAAKAEFPQGMDYQVPYNPTEYIAASVDAVEHTLIEAVLLVVLVVIIFLQTWRAAVIPIIAIPVSLVGVAAVQLALGFSLNTLSLFALILAVGIVVDDAIVVVEGVERHIRQGMSPRDAAYKTMEEVSGALIAIGLVLVSVFVPTALVPGIPGAFYRQFAVAISAASIISLIVSLTLSPALAAMILKPHHSERPLSDFPAWQRPPAGAGRKFNETFESLSARYGRFTTGAVRKTGVFLIIYAVLIALTGWRLAATPTGFIPQQDQGYLVGVVQLPAGASLDRTEAAMRKVMKIVEDTPGIKQYGGFAGLSGATFAAASNQAVIFVLLDDYKDRVGRKDRTAEALSGALMGRSGAVTEAMVFFLAPPPVQGLDNGGGFTMMVQDRSGAGYNALSGATFAMMGAAQQEKRVNSVFTQFDTNSPRIALDLDRSKAQMLGVAPADVYETLGIYLGSRYVNDFNQGGRTFRVIAQSEPESRADISDIANLKVRSASGAMVPIGSLATLRNDAGAVRIVRYNMFPAAELQGSASPGVSSGEALKAMEEMAAKVLPPGFGYEWTGIALQQQSAGNLGILIFGMAVVFVFLVLAANYESVTAPLAVILIVPMCILAAILGVNLLGQDNNILTQIGLIVLVALAAKNAILIVAFAKHAEDERGLKPEGAAVEAAGARLRPILMTSFAFIFGVLPLAIATGAGSEMRQALGIAVFFGMIGVTLAGLVFTPVFYVVCRWLGDRLPHFNGRKARLAAPPAPPPAEAPAHE
jgi:hydrophobe/amphiphile efflux-1 (HAE1) family protein